LQSEWGGLGADSRGLARVIRLSVAPTHPLLHTEAYGSVEVGRILSGKQQQGLQGGRMSAAAAAAQTAAATSANHCLLWLLACCCHADSTPVRWL